MTYTYTYTYCIDTKYNVKDFLSLANIIYNPVKAPSFSTFHQ